MPCPACCHEIRSPCAPVLIPVASLGGISLGGEASRRGAGCRGSGMLVAMQVQGVGSWCGPAVVLACTACHSTALLVLPAQGYLVGNLPAGAGRLLPHLSRTAAEESCHLPPCSPAHVCVNFGCDVLEALVKITRATVRRKGTAYTLVTVIILLLIIIHFLQKASGFLLPFTALGLHGPVALHPFTT